MQINFINDKHVFAVFIQIILLLFIELHHKMYRKKIIFLVHHVWKFSIIEKRFNFEPNM